MDTTDARQRRLLAERRALAAGCLFEHLKPQYIYYKCAVVFACNFALSLGLAVMER
jgi:hypothetical protein